jgi:hypothetical protein
MAMPHQSKQSEEDQGGRDERSQIRHRDHGSNRDSNGNCCRHGEGVPHPEWQERAKHGSSPAFLHPHSHCEEPAHGRVYAMERAESKQGGPGR